MNSEIPPTPNRRFLRSGLVVLGFVCVLGVAGWFGSRIWLNQIDALKRALQALQQRFDDQQLNLAALRNDMRSNRQGFQDIASSNRVLHDELLGLSQRHALLEESVNKFANQERTSLQTLRRDEAAALLRLGQERLLIAGDLDGARHAYQLASKALASLDVAGIIDVRQTLANEQMALNGLTQTPAVERIYQFEQWTQRLTHLPNQPDKRRTNPDTAPWWQRLLAPLIRIQPSQAVPLTAADRLKMQDALTIELTLAHAALERQDITAFRATMQHIQNIAQRIWPPTKAQVACLNEIHQLTNAPLRLNIPKLGTTVAQLESLQHTESSP